MLTIVGILSIGLLSCFAGIVMFSYYFKRGCDPLGAGYISDANQVPKQPKLSKKNLNKPKILLSPDKLLMFYESAFS